jgi:fatty acid desaturase
MFVKDEFVRLINEQRNKDRLRQRENATKTARYTHILLAVKHVFIIMLGMMFGMSAAHHNVFLAVVALVIAVATIFFVHVEERI